MLFNRLLLIKMKKLHLVFTITILVSIIIYFLPSPGNETVPSDNKMQLPNYKVHIFYEGGFRNKETDGAYKNWYYEDRDVENKISSNFYPLLGIYSSNDPTTIDNHMRQIRDAGIGVVVVSWWPEEFEKSPPMTLLLTYAAKYKLKVTIHIQNYENRNIINLRKQLYQFFKLYRSHTAFYTTKLFKKSSPLPIIYINEACAISPSEWNKLLGYNSKFSVRGSYLDAFYVGLIVKETDKYLLQNSDFDGVYTYFASNNFSYASRWYNWPYIQDFAKDRGLLFIPTVSPGYDDKTTPRSQIKLKANRTDGRYYTAAWIRAVVCRSQFISINSFNGWPQGTQIEPARPNMDKNSSILYDDYGEEGPDKYMLITRQWLLDFTNRSLYRTF